MASGDRKETTVEFLTRLLRTHEPNANTGEKRSWVLLGDAFCQEIEQKFLVALPNAEWVRHRTPSEFAQYLEDRAAKPTINLRLAQSRSNHYNGVPLLVGLAPGVVIVASFGLAFGGLSARFGVPLAIALLAAWTVFVCLAARHLCEVFECDRERKHNRILAERIASASNSKCR